MKLAVFGLAALMLTAAPVVAQQAAPQGAVAVATAKDDESLALSQTETGLGGLSTVGAVAAGGVFAGVIIFAIAVSNDDDSAPSTTTGTR